MKIWATTDNGIPVQDLTEPVRAIYDALYGSMDAGSGFLDTEDWEALLIVAKTIDASNLLKVQSEYLQLKFPNPEPHDFHPDRNLGDLQIWQVPGVVYCAVCGQPARSFISSRAIHGASVVPSEDREEALAEQEAERQRQVDSAEEAAKRARIQARLDEGTLAPEDF